MKWKARISIIKFLPMQKLLSNIFLGLLFCIGVIDVYAQPTATDIDQVAKKDFSYHKFDKRKVTYLFAETKNPIVKYNPVSLVFGSLMFFYQKVLSPQISANCPYEISCSNFSKACIKKFGLIKGIALSADRLMRCNRFTAMDIKLQDIDLVKGKIKDDPERYKRKR